MLGGEQKETALLNAAHVVEEAATNDYFGDLDDLISQRNNRLQNSFLEQESQSLFSMIDTSSFSKLPDIIMNQYQSIFDFITALQSRCFMGIFPEINRVWISIDNRLYLWNYDSNEE